MKTEIHDYTWEQFGKDADALAEMIRKTGRRFQNVYGPPRGGLCLAVCLSHRLGIPMILDAEEVETGTLVVDDIADKGTTLFPYAKAGNFIVTLFYHRQSRVIPNFWLHEKKGKFILFPWEDREKELKDSRFFPNNDLLRGDE